MSVLIERVARAMCRAAEVGDGPCRCEWHFPSPCRADDRRHEAVAAIREVLAVQQAFLDRRPRELDQDVQMLICASALLLMFARENGIEP